MKPSTKDNLEGSAKVAKGNVKQGVGKLVGNDRLRANGRADEVEGKVQKKVGQIEKVLDS